MGIGMAHGEPKSKDLNQESLREGKFLAWQDFEAIGGASCAFS
jgi:hypothetical protein